MRPIDADAALKALRKCQTYLYDARDPELKIELSSAEAAINNLPTIQPVATDICVGDTISRQAARHALCKAVHKGEDIPCENQTASCLWTGTRVCDFVREIDALPTIQPERKKGEWLPDNNYAYEMRFVCSCCKESEVVPTIGFTKYKPLWDFCPNCGADMRGEKDG